MIRLFSFTANSPAGRSATIGGVSTPEYRIAIATEQDAGEILTLQRAAYQSEALLYGDPELPPLLQTIDELREELATEIYRQATSVGIGWASNRRTAPADLHQMPQDLFDLGRISDHGNYIHG